MFPYKMWTLCKVLRQVDLDRPIRVRCVVILMAYWSFTLKAKLLVYKIYKAFVAYEHVLWVVTEDKVHRIECRK